MQGHYDPNQPHPAEIALRDIMVNIRVALQGSQNLPDFINGPLVSISLTSEQRAAVEAQTRTLRGLEQMIVERYPEVIK